MRAAASTAAAAVVVLLLGTAAASAHALRVASSPDDGATLKQPPAQVSVTFSEQPDPRLSDLKVLDTSGAQHQKGKAAAAPGQPATLAVPVDHLSDGVYTVSWRTVSQVDGHLASGAFSFGVGVAPSGARATASVSNTPSPSATALASRWVFYVGMMLLVGAAFLRLLLGPLPDRVGGVVTAGWLLAALGVLGITEAARSGAGLSLSRLFHSSLGHGLALRGIPLLATATAVVSFVVLQRRRWWPAALLALGAAATMAGEVATSHAAAARSWRWFQEGAQWVHFASVSAWLGGLAVLVLVVGAMDAAARGRAARRYSATVAVVLVLVVVAAAQRAFAEVGAWGRLWSTTFGRWVFLKIALLAGLVALGALNRYRHVGGAGETPRPLLRTARGEMAIAVVVLVATAFLQNLAPASLAAAKAPKPLVVEGHDFGTTVRVALDVTPGMAGFNRFAVDVADYDSRKPVDALVSLRFDVPARPEVGSSTLDLTRARPGRYQGQGANLSLDGTWRVTVLVQRSPSAVEVPLTVTTRQAPQRVTASSTPGLPTIYTVHLAGGRSLQVYLDPGKPGLNEFHQTWIGPDGSELAIATDTPTAVVPGTKAPQTLTTRKLDDLGHYVSDVTGGRGRYQFTVEATTADGTPLTARVGIIMR